MAKRATKPKEGNVYVSTTKGVYPFSLLKAAATPTSKQIVLDQKWMMEEDLVPPPFSVDGLLSLYESNSTLCACIRQIARDVAGLGWKIILKEEAKENNKELEKINAFIGHPNDEYSLRYLFDTSLVDWGAVGWFGLEVVRNAKGEIVELFRVPAHTLKVHNSGDKYCQIRGQSKVWFKRFGIEENFSSKTGKEGTYNLQRRANELIYYKNFYPRSDYYGAPNFISAIGDIMGLISIRDYNLNFFQNYGVPSAIIILKGPWATGSDKTVTRFLEQEMKGTDNAHRTLTVQQPDDCSFEYTPLRTEIQEGSFRLYQKNLKENVLVAYSMPPERVGVRVVGELGGSVAEEATKIYVQSVIEPLQTDLEDIINHNILEQGLDCHSYRLKFNDIDTRDLDLLVIRLDTQIRNSTMTPNDARKLMGRTPYDEGDKFYVDTSLVEAGEAEIE